MEMSPEDRRITGIAETTFIDRVITNSMDIPRLAVRLEGLCGLQRASLVAAVKRAIALGTLLSFGDLDAIIAQVVRSQNEPHAGSPVQVSLDVLDQIKEIIIRYALFHDEMFDEDVRTSQGSNPIFYLVPDEKLVRLSEHLAQELHVSGNSLGTWLHDAGHKDEDPKTLDELALFIQGLLSSSVADIEDA